MHILRRLHKAVSCKACSLEESRKHKDKNKKGTGGTMVSPAEWAKQQARQEAGKGKDKGKGKRMGGLMVMHGKHMAISQSQMLHSGMAATSSGASTCHSLRIACFGGKMLWPSLKSYKLHTGKGGMTVKRQEQGNPSAASFILGRAA